MRCRSHHTKGTAAGDKKEIPAPVSFNIRVYPTDVVGFWRGGSKYFYFRKTQIFPLSICSFTICSHKLDPSHLLGFKMNCLCCSIVWHLVDQYFCAITEQQTSTGDLVLGRRPVIQYYSIQLVRFIPGKLNPWKSDIAPIRGRTFTRPFPKVIHSDNPIHHLVGGEIRMQYR